MSGVLRLTALALLSAVAVHSAPIDTCDVQSSCLKVTMGSATSTACASQSSCAWRVCVTLDLNSVNPMCVKGSGTVSHTCQKSDSTCGGGSWSTALEVGNLPDGFNMCQTGAPGQTLEFLLKDGSGCQNSRAALNITGAGKMATMQCAPSTSESCTGNAPGVECIWSVQLPSSCPGTSASPATSLRGMPSASPKSSTVPSTSPVASPKGMDTMPSDSPASSPTGTSTESTSTSGSTSNSESGTTTAGSGSVVNIATVTDCTQLEAQLPERLMVFESDDIPTCDIDGALAMLGDTYQCEQPSKDCLFLQCRQPIPESTLAALKTVKC